MRRPILLAASILLLAPSSHGMYLNWIVQNSSCGNPVGWLKVTPVGGTPPYTYSWDTGATTDSIGGIVGAGQWFVVTVTDAMLQSVVDSNQVGNDPALNVYAVTSYIANSGGSGYGMHPCPGQCNGGLVVHQEFINGLGPYSIGFDLGTGFVMNDDSGNPVYGGFCDDDYVTLLVQDALGCTGSASQYIAGPAGLLAQVVSVDGACGGGANGSVRIAVPQDPNYFSNWIYLLDDLGQTIDGCYPCGDTVQFTGLAPGNYAIRHTWMAVVPGCEFLIPFTVPDLGLTCGNVSGTLYFDHDQDCTQDANDPGIPNRILTIAPGTTYTITDANGQYSRNLINGSYDLAVTGTDLLQICPAASPIPFVISSGSLIMQDIADSSTLDLDLEVLLHHGAARPGFNSTCWATVRNLSGQLSGPVTIDLTFDPVFTFSSADPAPASVTGNLVTWNLAALNSFGTRTVWVALTLPPLPGLVGDPFTQSVTCSNTLAEATLANNSTLYNGTITASFDPNDKLVRTSTGWSDSEYIIGSDEWLDYTIRFQNTGTDTAFTVAIVDTIDMDLDLSTLDLLGASHPFTPGFDADRVVRFTFENILLPDSTTNEPASHGFIAYRIRPNAPLLPGTVLSNAADIHFDFNPPVHTNDAVVVAGTSTSTGTINTTLLSVYPTAAESVVHVTWSDDFHPLSLRVIGADGRTVLQAPFPGASMAGMTIDVERLGSGVFLVEARDRWGKTLVSRFLKQ